MNKGIGYFPDARTSRGVRHIRELIETKASGDQAAIVFIVQRPDVKFVKPNKKADREFTEALTLAKTKGVNLFAYRCRVDLSGVNLHEQIPVTIN